MLIFLTLADSEEERALLEELYIKHRSDMFALARSYLKNDYDAEDAVQTVFCNAAMKHMGALMSRDADSRRRFLLLAVKHRSLDELRKRGKLVPLEEEVLDGMTFYTDEGFIDAICERALSEQLNEAVNKLDSIYKDVLWLRLSLDMTAAEIGEVVGENEETIKKRLQRGKRKLISLLGIEGGAA